jgi:hypothetical protein
MARESGIGVAGGEGQSENGSGKKERLHCPFPRARAKPPFQRWEKWNHEKTTSAVREGAYDAKEKRWRRAAPTLSRGFRARFSFRFRPRGGTFPTKTVRQLGLFIRDPAFTMGGKT